MKRIGLLGTLFVISFMFLVEAGLGAIKYCPDPLRRGYGTCAVYSDPGCVNKIGYATGDHYLRDEVVCLMDKMNGLFYFPFPTCAYYCEGSYWIKGSVYIGCPNPPGWDMSGSEGEACLVAWTTESGTEEAFEGFWDSDWGTCVECWGGAKYLKNDCSCSSEQISPRICEKACNAPDVLDEWPAYKVKIIDVECPSRVARGKSFWIHVNSSGSNVNLEAWMQPTSGGEITPSACQEFTYKYPCKWHISDYLALAPELTGNYIVYVYGKGGGCPKPSISDYDTYATCTVEVVECLWDGDCPAKNGTKGKCVCPEPGCSIDSPDPEEWYKCKWQPCESSSDCDVNYCCPREIGVDADCADAPAGTIINYGGKSYLCDPPGWSSNNEIQKAQISLPQNKKGKHDLLSSLVEYLVKIFSG